MSVEVLDGFASVPNIPVAPSCPPAHPQTGVHRLMMMAPDRTPEGPELSAASCAALASALENYAARADATSLQPALQRIAMEAREKRMHAEQLLIVLKDVWYAVPFVAQAPHGELQNRLLQRVVTLCIREYYSAQ